MIQPWFPPVALPTINPPESVLNAASDVLSDLPISSLLSMAELGMCRAELLLSPLIVAMFSTREAAAGLSSGPSPLGAVSILPTGPRSVPGGLSSAAVYGFG
ncbi:hypothetical protein LAUMK4_00593 [Mycobacterium persicum]|uniref:Uncharacterized protein n=1 Tax=Mycobacterium persicum TaxID=1487726 RepID=A0ABY6RCS8_9MYCO|nr:hypothetical protein LAUMK15_00946 [Mycobacterium persicum]VAZ88115.1 hypothetical protein LAUMK4_00593 [Mycobacterium persicum]